MTSKYNISKERMLSKVVKRSGRSEQVDVLKIEERISRLLFGLNTEHIKIQFVVQKVIQGMYDGITTVELDELAAETCAYLNILHPHYSILAARIAVSNLHKQTNDGVVETAEKLYNYKDITGAKASLLSEEVY